MKRFALLSSHFLLIFLFFSCASQPETPSEAKTVVTEPVEVVTEESVEPEIPVPEPVKKELIEEAQQYLQKAESIGAKNYGGKYYTLAVEGLEKGEALAEKDPDKARESLRTSISNSKNAYNSAIENQITEKTGRLRAMEMKLNELDTKKFEPEAYAIVKTRSDKLIELLENKEYSAADSQYESTLRAMINLEQTLNANIRWIKILDRDTRSYLEDAEEQEVFIYAAMELEKANDLYLHGLSRFNNYDLVGSEKSLRGAKYWAFQSLKLNKERARLKKTDKLMDQAMKSLEEASKKRVLDEDGSIIEATPWQGVEYLDENPPSDTKSEQFNNDDSSLKEYNPDDVISGDKETSYLSTRTTSVLGDEEKATLLDQAILLWKEGVKARATGKFDVADEYFKQSKAYSDAYSQSAVAFEYTVEKKDTLWAIAAKKEILDNPFLWTKLWRRNRLEIENPDLIFPGQKLIIPPK